MMISLIQHIEYLMMYHDCVVVPGWGALVANYTSSEINGRLVARPSRWISYNSYVDHNDGLLASSLMRRHGMTYENACRFISDNVTLFRRQIDAGTELAFGHLGSFTQDSHRRLQFVPTVTDDAFNDFFGLRDFEFDTLSQVTQTAAEIADNIVISWRERLKVAASIAAIVGVGLLLSTPVIIDRASQTASLAPVQVKTQPAPPSHPSVTVKPLAKATVHDKQFALIDEKSEEASVTSVKSNTQQEIGIERTSPYNEGMPSRGHFLLVVNSCSNSKQAEKIISSYFKRGLKAKAVKRGKYHHIVVAQSDSQQELAKIKKTLPEKYDHAWVCK